MGSWVSLSSLWGSKTLEVDSGDPPALLCRSKTLEVDSGDCPAISVECKTRGKGPGSSPEADTLVQGDPTSSLGPSKTVKGISGQPQLYLNGV